MVAILNDCEACHYWDEFNYCIIYAVMALLAFILQNIIVTVLLQLFKFFQLKGVCHEIFDLQFFP